MSSALLVGAGAPRASAASVRSVASKPSDAPYQDWPMYLGNPQRTAATTDPNLAVANAPLLQLKWSYKTGAGIAASATVVGTTAYVGSWDGYEYAFNTGTGAVEWKQNLGTTLDTNCLPYAIGITSAPAVVDGVVYVGGGDSYFYALDASTGVVLWKLYVGNTADTYNWSSPLIVNGAAYAGVASNCDKPLVQGSVIKIDLASHAVVATYATVPQGHVGGGVWTSPTYDAATNTVFVSTGTREAKTDLHAEAIVGLDAATLQETGYWPLPATEEIADSDFGTTPTLMTDANNDQLIAAANKNGILYALNRNNLAAGPIWRLRVAVGGVCPTCGDGSIASGVFANGSLYYAGGHFVAPNGHGSGGSIRSVDPATGNVQWLRQTDYSIVGAPAYVNGMVAYVEGSTFEVLDASNGNLLYSYVMSARNVAAVSVARSEFFVGEFGGVEYAFGLGAAQGAPPADPNCPAGFTCRDVGSHPAGSESLSGGTLTVHSSGASLATASDQYRSITEPVTGDSESSVTLVQQSNQGTQPQAGLMVRQPYGAGTVTGAPYFAALASPNNTVTVSYRSVFATKPVTLTTYSPANKPVTLMIQRQGNLFSAGVSSDGAHFTLVPGGSALVDLPTTVLEGLAVNSGSASAYGSAGFTNLSVGNSVSTVMAPVAPAHACPGAGLWICADIGNPTPAGDAWKSNGNFVLAGTGSGVAPGLLWFTNSDSVHYVYKSKSGAHSISARITTPTPKSTAEAGLMMRESGAPTAPMYSAYLTAGGSLSIQWRAYDGVTNRFPVAVPSVNSPAYIKIVRIQKASPPSTVFETMTSTDGVGWTLVPKSAVTIDMGAGAYLMGMFATSDSTTATAQSIFAAVTAA